jgi:radical SAM superfamily enzyme YgiQ (UPF0313 family)
MPAECDESREDLKTRSLEDDRVLTMPSADPFSNEIALYEKERHRGDINVLIAVPDFYHVALPNIGHQVIEHEINQIPGFFAYRCYLRHDFGLLRESTEPPDIVLLSMSYEGSYIRALRVLDLLGLEPLASRRKSGDPLVIGGRAVSMNPLPLFYIDDVIGIGDGDGTVRELCRAFREAVGDRRKLLDRLVELSGVLLPSRYEVAAGAGALETWIPRDAPRDIEPSRSRTSSHSWYLSSETDYNDIGYYAGKTFFSVEIVKACASTCLFCAEGFNNGRMRFTDDTAGVTTAARWAKSRGADLIKLFFPANSTIETTKGFMKALLELGLPPRVGSAKAEKIDGEYIDLIGRAGQEKIAIAPETGDYLLRLRLGKPGMTDNLLFRVFERIFQAGIPNLDLYFIANLPGEAPDSFQKTMDFIDRVARFFEERSLPGRFRISMPNFFPKAWTPFQYAPAGPIEEYIRRIEILERTFGARVKVSHMRGQVDLLSQNVMSRGGDEVSLVLADVYGSLREREQRTGNFTPDTFEDWRHSFSRLEIDEQQYFAERPIDRPQPWHHIRLYQGVGSLIRAWEVFRQRRNGES